MPNWVTNRVNAPQHVLEAMLSEDKPRVDFNKIITCEFPHDWGGYFLNSEAFARETVGESLCISQDSLEERVAKLGEEERQQYYGMVENYKTTGYFNFMQFAREVWGTKWNASRSDVDFIDQGQIMFKTAWSYPHGVFQKLSEKFPDDEITVTFADENIGYNCGTIKFLNGQIAFEDIAPTWEQCSVRKHRAKWIEFACEVQGYDYENYRKELEEAEE